MSYSGILTREQVASRIAKEKFGNQPNLGTIYGLGLVGPQFRFEYTRPNEDKYFLSWNLERDSTHILRRIPNGRNITQVSGANYHNSLLLDDGSVLSFPFKGPKDDIIRTKPVIGMNPLLTTTAKGYAVANEKRIVFYNKNFEPVIETELEHTIDSVYADDQSITVITQQTDHIDIHSYAYSSLERQTPFATHSLEGRLSAQNRNFRTGETVLALHDGNISQLHTYDGFKTKQIPLSFDLGEYAPHFQSARDSISAVSVDSQGTPFIGLSNGLVLLQNEQGDQQLYAALGNAVSHISNNRGWRTMATDDGTIGWATEKIDEPIRIEPRQNTPVVKKHKPSKNTVLSASPEGVKFHQKVTPGQKKYVKRYKKW